MGYDRPMDTIVQSPVDYTEDEHAWLLEQAGLLSAGRVSEIDCENLSEFLTAMARSDRRELRTRLRVLMMHILKCEMQPERISRSWVLTILEQQDAIRSDLEESATLTRIAAELVPAIGHIAARHAAAETGASPVPWPMEMGLEQVLSYSAQAVDRA